MPSSLDDHAAEIARRVRKLRAIPFGDQTLTMLCECVEQLAEIVTVLAVEHEVNRGK